MCLARLFGTKVLSIFVSFRFICSELLPLDLWRVPSLQVQRSLPVSPDQKDATPPSFFISSASFNHNCKTAPSPHVRSCELSPKDFMGAEVLLMCPRSGCFSGAAEKVSEWVFFGGDRARPDLGHWLGEVGGWGKLHKPTHSRHNACLAMLLFYFFFGTRVSCLHNPRGF